MMVASPISTLQQRQETTDALSRCLEDALLRLSAEQIYTHGGHNFKQSGDRLRGGCPHHDSKSGSSFVVTISSKLFWCEGCQFGGSPADYRASLRAGRWVKARGKDFVEAVRELAADASVPFPERESSPEEIAKAQKWERRRAVLAATQEYCREALWSDTEAAKTARHYLVVERGLTEEEIKLLPIGYYKSAGELKHHLISKGFTKEDWEGTGCCWKDMERYITFLWNDASGRPLTIYGRYFRKYPPEGKDKTIAAPGEKTKQSPLYFDRTLKAGHKEIVLVEGVLDAVLLQAKGDTRVCAYVAASCSGDQIETLKRRGISKVTLCGDPDHGGEKGTNSNLLRLTEAGISVYIAPKLPDELDPDEFLIREGMEGWKAHIDAAEHGFRWKAQRLIESGNVATDKGKAEVLRDAITFCKAVKNHPELDIFFWPVIRSSLGMEPEEFRAQLERLWESSPAEVPDLGGGSGDGGGEGGDGDGGGGDGGKVLKFPSFEPLSSSDIPDSFNPKAEFTQFTLEFLYGDKPWICVDGKLYHWAGTHYKYSKDTVEIRRLADFCNSYAVPTKGGLSYPYAKPSKVKEALEWVKMRLSVDSELVNPPGLNCTNGVLQIEWNVVESNPVPQWRLIDHSPELYYTYEPQVKYDPEADSQACDRLLAVLDAPQRDIFLKTIAASLDLATIRQHKGRLVRGLLLKGHGSNGKDTLREAVSMIYGRQGMTGCTLSDYAAYDEGRKFPLARLKHSRVNWASENANTTRLDKIQSLKAFITGDTLSAEGKGKDENEFAPTGIALFNVNDTPKLQGTLEAIAGRYGVLSFNKTFKIGADPSKGELEADPRFKYDPNFLRSEVLPAFLNRVLDALQRVMVEGIDYSCTQKALEDIQAENSHLFQFCQDTGLNYETNAILTAGEIWERLEQWYQDNGTLAYEETSTGKQKAVWTEQANPSDRNIKGANQVLGRFQQLFPKCKRVTVTHPNGKKKVQALQGIGFICGGNTPDGERDNNWEAPTPTPTPILAEPTPVPPQHPPQKTTENQGFHPTHPSFLTPDEKIENQLTDSGNVGQGLQKNSDTPQQLGWVGCDDGISRKTGVDDCGGIGVETLKTGVAEVAEEAIAPASNQPDPMETEEPIAKIPAEQVHSEVDPWMSEENLAAIADDLNNCPNKETLAAFREVWEPAALNAACKRLSPERHAEIKRWVLELNGQRDTSEEDLVLQSELFGFEREQAHQVAPGDWGWES